MCSRTTLVCCLVAAALATVCAQRPELYEGDACSRVAGVEWTCKKLKDCLKAQEGLENGLRPETCGFTGDEVIVCCEPTQSTTRPTQPIKRPRPTATQTTKRPTPTQTTKRLTPTQTTKRPTSTQTTKRPTPTQTTKRPTSTQTTKRPTPTQTTKRPTPTQTTKRPTPTHTTKRPTPTQTTKRPTPTQTTKRPTPTQPTKRPTPSRTTKRPIPTPKTKRPTPTRTTKRPVQPSQRCTQERGGRSKQMCKKYAESVFHKETSITGQVQTFNLCTLIVEPLITNGTKAQPREFPHMALIGYGEKNKIQWKCGGSLISERWVLSAAHCTLTGNDRPKWVRLGEYNVRSTQDDDEKTARSEDFDIIETINHPEYDEKNVYNDIALYKLNRDVVFSEYVRPICLQTEYQIPKKEGLITGWGRTGYSQRASDILQKGNVTFISGRQCRDSLKTIANLKREIQDNTMICAANFLTNTDTCQGDSGGPLQFLLSDPYCMYSQVGITSFGIRCASNFPAVYTRVSHFVPWIERIVWP